MEKERRIKILSIVALIVAILGLTVAFAALSETLTINGTASVEAASWDIHFENLSDAVLTGDASVATPPTLNNTSITDFESVLTKPGDSITYEFDIVNDGTIDAKIGAFDEVAWFCQEYRGSVVGSNEEARYCDLDDSGDVTITDGSIQLENFSYTLTYKENGQKVKENDILNHGETKRVVLKLEYLANSTWIPSHELKFPNLEKTIEYVQK